MLGQVLLFDITSFHYPHLFPFKHCGGLDVKCRLMCLDAWFLGGGGVWKSSEPLGGAPSPEDWVTRDRF